MSYEIDNRLLEAIDSRQQASTADFPRARARERHLRLVIQEADFSEAKRKELAKKGHAMPDGSYPIVTKEHLKDAIQAVGRAPEGKRKKVRQHIVKRAKDLGATGLLPSNWAESPAEEASESPAQEMAEAADSMAKASTPEPWSTSKTSNWVAKTGPGLPPYIQHISHDIHEKRGIPESQAIAIAIGVVKRWARGGGKVDETTRAAARKALQEWESLKARNKAKKG